MTAGYSDGGFPPEAPTLIVFCRSAKLRLNTGRWPKRKLNWKAEKKKPTTKQTEKWRTTWAETRLSYPGDITATDRFSRDRPTWLFSERLANAIPNELSASCSGFNRIIPKNRLTSWVAGLLHYSYLPTTNEPKRNAHNKGVVWCNVCLLANIGQHFEENYNSILDARRGSRIAGFVDALGRIAGFGGLIMASQNFPSGFVVVFFVSLVRAVHHPTSVKFWSFA